MKNELPIINVDILIVGAGPAGLAAAISAKKAGVDSLIVLEREENAGGILRQCIHNGFGLHRFKEELTGPEYAQRDIDTAAELGIDVRTGVTVLSVTKDKVVTAISKKYGLQIFQAKAVVLAMGCRERPRGALAIPGTRCAGIYSAGTAQKFVNLEGFMPGRRVVILGSGDIGLIMARRMTLEGCKVQAVCEICPYSNGLTRNMVQCLYDFDIPLYLSHTILKIKGRDRVEGVTVAKVDARMRPIPGTEFDIDCDTLLLSVGLIPENELSRAAGVEIAPFTNGPKVDQHRQTSLPGIYAAGNVVHVHDLVDFVSDEADIAGKFAALDAQGRLEPVVSTVAVKLVDGVRTCVPQVLHLPREGEATRLFMRVGAPARKVTLEVKCGGEVLVKRLFPVVKPSEMITLDIPADKTAVMKDEITVGLKAD